MFRSTPVVLHRGNVGPPHQFHRRIPPAARPLSTTYSPAPTTVATKTGEPDNFMPVYVHQVSKSVLEHLQTSRSDWLREQGLHQGLKINRNGTFVLQFPARDGYDSGRIWTYYDTSTKQHWLSLYRGKLSGRFLLKDTTAHIPGTRLETIERGIQATVDQMIQTLAESDVARHPQS